MEETKADFPPSSPPLPDDYSDVESAHSSEVEEDAATERRKYQRGGRKKSTTQTTRESRMPPVPESEVGAEPSHREEFSLEHGDTHINGGSRMNGKINTTRVEQERDPEMEMEKEMEGKVCPECAARKQQAAPATQQAEQKQQSAFETGIRAFNLKRAADSAGRPVSVRAEKKKSKKKEKAKKKKKKKREPEVDETDESSSDEDEDEETEKKPAGMAIRLDLNLIVEIFLKAKIQGDVTITFLE